MLELSELYVLTFNIGMFCPPKALPSGGGGPPGRWTGRVPSLCILAAGRFKGGGVDLDRDAIAQADRLPGPADDHCPALFPRVRRGVPGKFEQKGPVCSEMGAGRGFWPAPVWPAPGSGLERCVVSATRG
jgi:hypothetical protein